MEPDYSPAFNQAMRRTDRHAARMDHDYIGTEHLLLSLLEDRQDRAAGMLTELGLNRVTVRQRIEDYVADPRQKTGVASAKALTPRARKAVEQARKEAGERMATAVGTEHLLLALLKDEKSVSAQVLAAFGVDYATVRARL